GSVIDQTQIEAVRAVDTQRELLRQVPGVSLIRHIRIPVGGKGYTNNLIDGLSTRSASLGTFGYLDEVNLFDVQAVELTRGPGSVLHSSKAVGGTINVITRDPPKEQERSIFAEGGMYGFARVGAAVAGSTLGGGLGYSVSANHLQDDAWRDRSAREKDQASTKFVLKPDEDTKITVRGEYTNYFTEYPGVLTKAQFDANWRQAQFTNLYEDKEFLTGSIDLKRRVGEGGQLELAYAAHRNTGVDGCPSGCSSAAASTTEVDIDYLTNNFRALYRQDFDFLKSRFYVGLDAFLSKKEDDVWNRTQNTFKRTTKNRAFTIDETTLAPFAQYEFSPIEGLRFNVGARYEDYHLDADDRSPTTNRDGNKHYSDLVKKAGVTYEWTRNHRLWGSVAEGFFVPDTGSTITGENPKDLPPEESLTYSAGVRGELMGRLFGYDVGYYHTDIENFSQSVTCPGNAKSATCPDWANARSSYALAGDARFKGIETSLFARPWEFLRFDVAHTYAINSYIDYKDRFGDYSGNMLPASPKHHVNARVTVVPIPGLSVQLEADYYSSYYLNALNNDSYARPIIYKMRVAYQASENVELWAHALNLFDTKYADRISATNVAAPVRSYNEGYMPLTVRAGVALKW
ncbi:MAG: TonB-dependent receptor, partial [Hyphomicrobium sp.]